jgi:ATP-dependent Clp protease, protease subunit|tara:strand:+ start:5178 stop:5804 length:627 start_codon:yes stop_codon:yes gene_type:complete
MSDPEVAVPDDMDEVISALSMAAESGKDKSSGIEIEENHIYFYTHVTDREALELVRILRRMDIEMGYLSERIGLRSRPPVHLHIQSPGGDVFSALNICDAIDRCKTDVYTYVEGSAASAATIIASRGKKRYISKRSFMLIHQPQIIWAGKHDEFIDEIENQKNIFQTVKDVYLETTKILDADLEELLRHELWLPAEKCLELGLVDKIL